MEGIEKYLERWKRRERMRKPYMKEYGTFAI